LTTAENYARYVNGSAIGILLFLTTFGALIALIAKDKTFLLFGAWSFTSLRTVAVNDGWATNWLFENLSETALPIALGGSLSLHCLFTALLFGALFERELTGNRAGKLHSLICAVFAGLLLLSPFWESPFYYPAVWTTAGLGMIFVACTLVSALRRSSASVHRWYASFWIVTFAGLAGEIAYTSGLLQSPHVFFNVRTGALASALLMAITVAQRFLAERVERRRAQESEIVALKDLANTYESMPIGLFRIKDSGEISLHNAAFARAFDLPADVENRKGESVSAKTLFGSDAYAALLAMLSADDSKKTIVVASSSSKGTRYLQFTARQAETGLEGSVQDVTARVTAENALARLVDHDVQTKALNQRGLNDAVKRAVQVAASGTPCALVELDVDRFKTLNDLYGHLVGDLLLAAVCDRLLEELRRGDAIARIGDSFRIVLFGCDSDESMACAKRLHQAISSKPIEVGGRILTVSASVGLVPIDDGMDVRDVIAASSQACAEAKLKGRNRVVHMAKQDLALRGYLEELKVQENLQDKINSQRFFLEYQPIVSFQSAFETLNYEVLVRMRGENGATISPGRFIPAAERNGQMSLIDRWVLLKTLHWLNDHTEHLKRLDYATINLSGSSLNDARFVDNIFAMISDFPNVMTKLCFEITETVALADRRATRRFSERVHSMGGKVALDDFGAGYTSFTYLREIEADIIKIDGSFVRDINQNPANHAITRMIVELSHELGKRCVAEWAEHPDVIATLMQLGVDYGQGYALARPMAPEALMFAGSCGDLVMEPTVRALLKGTLSPQQVAANPSWGASQTALF
jgi:diguanylate cyclase (GGDEF)-like protein